ncbi:MAG TPA: hypothetical protein VFW89_00150 [Gemmatimonadaceae bacterium]|nr:hypothetical protein [Gemmatimonadaceae bacterium]
MRFPGRGILVPACVLSVCATARRAQAQTCRSPDDLSADVLHFVRDLLTSTDAGDARLRDSVALSPITDTTKVVVVTDERTCSKVLAGVNAEFRTAGLARTLYVVKTPNGYFAQDPDRPTGEWRPLVVLTKQYQPTGMIAAF